MFPGDFARTQPDHPAIVMAGSGETLTYRGSMYDADFIPRLQIDILTHEDKVEAIVKTILHAGRTGQVGDGKIIVFNVDQVVRSRTGELTADAI